jgi:IQ calmodulin-binding motif
MNKFPIISPNARSHEFTKKHFGLYQDNSLEKAQRLKSLMSSNGRLFKKREKFLIEQINQRKLLKTQLATQHKLDEMVNQLMIQRKTRKDLEFNAAVRIQKHIRGFLARKECEKNITNLIRFHSNYCVNSMEKTILSLWIDLKYYGAVICI